MRNFAANEEQQEDQQQQQRQHLVAVKLNKIERENMRLWKTTKFI